MDMIIKLVSEQLAGLLVGAAVVGLPIMLKLAIQALRAGAKKTKTPLDDAAVEALAHAVEDAQKK